MPAPNTVDSNQTGLSYALESAPKTLSAPTWYPLEPNSYDSFGASFSKTGRRPIGPSRSKKKGVVTGLEASVGWNQDLTFSNMTALLQGFFFATIREQKTTLPLNGAQIPISAVSTTDDSYAVASGMPAFLANDLILAVGFSNSANNGLKTASVASTSTKFTCTEDLVNEASPPAAAYIKKVGYKFASGTVDMVLTGSRARINRASGSVDFTTLGFTAGSWMFVGGDSAGLRFVNNQGWARVRAVGAAYIELDKATFTPVNETGTGLTVQIFFGDKLQNEILTADQVARSYQFERTLGNDGNGTQSEYVTGAYASELTINFPEEDKITFDLSYMGLGYERRSGTTGVKAGTRASLVIEDAFDTVNDTARFNMSIDNLDGTFTPLYNYATDTTITINNNLTVNKALTVMGGVSVTAGLFEVGGSTNAYFSTISAIDALATNKPISTDIWIKRSQKVLMFDIPGMTLDDGKTKVELDKAVILPLNNDVHQHETGPSLTFQKFEYIPLLAG